MLLRSRALLATIVSALTLVVGLATAAPASAHDVLASTAPAADTTVGGDLDRVTLTFSEPPLAALRSGIVVSVTGPDGAERGSGAVDVDGSTLRRAADLTAAGDYTVIWRSVSVDGHPISGSYRFTSTGATAAAGEPSATATADAATPTPEPTAAASSEPSDSGSTAAAVPAADDGPGALPWVLGGVAVLIAGALVTILLVARRRRPLAED